MRYTTPPGNHLRAQRHQGKLPRSTTPCKDANNQAIRTTGPWLPSGPSCDAENPVASPLHSTTHAHDLSLAGVTYARLTLARQTPERQAAGPDVHFELYEIRLRHLPDSPLPIFYATDHTPDSWDNILA
jgi:hypothetical protein